LHRSTTQLRRSPHTGRPLAAVRPRWLSAAAFVLLAPTGAHAAPRPTIVVRTVKGAQVARFTLKQAGDLTLTITADRPTPLFGWMLAQVGHDRYVVDIHAAGYDRELQTSYGLPPAPSNPRGLHLNAGTYDLSLFSQTTATLRAQWTGNLPALHFGSRPLQASTTTSTDTSATWEHDFPVPIATTPHGAVVYMQDEWMGDGRSSQTACVWQQTRCPAISADTLDELSNSDDGLPGDHGSLYSESFGGAEFARPANTVTVQSVVVGQAKRHQALVVIVP
jgi:hypothetical protein